MSTIEKLRAPNIQRPIIAACALAVLFVLPRWGAQATTVGAAVSLIVYTVIFDCPKVVRWIMGFIALLACLAASYFLLRR